ncbi:MAG TPA: O-antigen ligase family protein [Chitinophagaceae bacterium]|nr:O-antigen ligase family protein [Chitinophagaceae bacterium]
MTKQGFLEYYTSICAMLFFSCAIIVPKAIGIFPGLILIVALPFLFSKKLYSSLTNNNLVLIGAFLLFGLLWILNSVSFLESSRVYGKPSRFIAGALVLIFVLKYPPKEQFLWIGIGIGGIATGVWALWEKLALGSQRVDAFTNAIQYGNISILLGVLSLVGIGWAYQKSRHRFCWITLLLSGFILGLLASALSGSRGGWIGLGFIIAYILIHFRSIFPKKLTLSVIILLSLTLTVLYLTPQTGIKNRIAEIGHNISLYSQGKASTSVGTRFEFWKASLLMIQEKPIWGWGQSGYTDKLTQLKSDKVINPLFIGHAHNEVLDTWSKRGAVGLLSLLLLYATPLYVFYISRKKSLTKATLPLMVSGGVITLSYIDFGLTQVFFAHNNGVMFYIFSLVFLYACLDNTQKALNPSLT